ncbi:MAG: tetratricopeptide repeat protein [Hyphomicrobiales bacterium]|nr:tetratricopeptide repeat protein [Hyphomicrobiales bacterium]MCP5373651.1 tetratricopeptide repeat protein [Hyphomicrobiales bacterium]
MSATTISLVDERLVDAVAHHRDGDLAAALAVYGQILEHAPGDARVWHLSGLARHGLGDAAGAAADLERAVVLDGGRADYHCNLAVARHALGDLAGAAAALDRAAALEPGNPETLANRGVLLRALGRLDAAEESLRAALAARPGDPVALNNLGTVLVDAGRFEEAVAVLRPAADAGGVEARVNLANALRLSGDAAAAEAALGPVLAADPAHAEALNILCLVRMAGRRFEDARDLADHAVAADPGHGLAWSNLGECRRQLDDLGGAIAAWQRAVALKPGLAVARFNLGSALALIGDGAGAVAQYRAAVAADPDDARIHGTLLMALHYAPGISRQAIFDEHLAWARRHAPAPQPVPVRDPDPDRRLRLGFLSADFRFHAVSFFLLPVLRAWPRRDWEIALYSGVARGDPYTDGFRAAADLWRDTAGLDDAALVDQIRGDGVDILVDLAGHTKDGRPGLFARRAAPVQAAWLDYVDTTGLPAMDFLVADAVQVPPEDDRFYVEQVVRLAPDCLCYGPPGYAGDPAPPPFRENGYVTLGCFSTAQKVGDGALDAWAAILRRLPGARLLLNGPEYRHGAARDRCRGRLAAGGVAADRIEFREGAVHREFLTHYADIDMALDPFPYSGGLNTCEALWMGVPVVTFAGERYCGRHAASHLRAAGLDELVAADAAGYVDLAVALASDRDRLADLRATLRGRVDASPLVDAPAFAARFAHALRGMWKQALTKH